MNLSGKGFSTLLLTFTNRDLARVCNDRSRLEGWASGDASSLMRLLNEIDSATSLGLLGFLPHVELAAAKEGRVAVWDAEEAYVLLEPDDDGNEMRPSAESARVVAVALREEQINPEGARWPRACAISLTTR